MGDTFFKMVSIFRILSVTKFTFGFTHKIASETESKKSDELSYAIHHFKSENDPKIVLQKIQALLPADIVIKYTGSVIANLYSQEGKKTPQQIPNLMDAILIFQSKTEEVLKSFFESKTYKEILDDLPSNHISMLKRIF